MATRESDFWNERAGPRIAPEHMGGILATAADIALVVSASGKILSVSVNPLNSGLGRLDHWDGRDLREFLAPDSIAKVEREIRAVEQGRHSATQPIEVNHTDGADWEAPIRYTLHATGREGRVLMLGRDLRPLAELQQRLIRAQMALERDYETQRVHETRFRALLSQTSDAVVLVDAGSGRVLEANARAADLLGTDQGSLQGSAFAQEFGNRRRAELIDALTAAGSGELGDPVKLTTSRAGSDLKVFPRVFRSAGDRVILCRLEPVDALAIHRSVRDGRLETLFRQTADAIVFTAKSGQIVEANEAFLSLVDLDSHADLRGRSLPDFLTRGTVDMRVLTDRNGPRIYATRIISAFGTHVPVEVVPTHLEEGMAFTLREADRLQPVRDASDPQNIAMENARSLVGSMPLRDIVASMTDEIEKECIETAVELTGNNRVAAAEMLGLSRQSLYVKLRKYKLLSRGE